METISDNSFLIYAARGKVGLSAGWLTASSKVALLEVGPAQILVKKLTGLSESTRLDKPVE